MILFKETVIDYNKSMLDCINLGLSCCFCKKPDLLQQWKEYGDNTQGLSLGFDIDWFNNLNHQTPHSSINQSQALGYYEVLYYSQHIEKEIYDVCYEGIKQYGCLAWIMVIRTTFKHYSAFIKNLTFFGEEEVRNVYYPNDFDGHNTNEANISDEVDIPIKHYCLPWSDSRDNNSLKAIIRGCNCNLKVSDIKKALNDSGLAESINVYDSKCSYRIR